MGDTSIEWTDKSWNPTTGCTVVTPGCDHCYAKTMHERFNGPGSFDTVTLHPDRLDKPLRWRKPRKVFVNSMSDLFHKDIPDEFIGSVFDVMAQTPQHTFQILTKRHARMRSLLQKWTDDGATWRRQDMLWCGPPKHWPLPNVWLGVSVEDQKRANLRIPALLATPAAVRFISAEPLLGAVDLHWCAGVDAIERDWMGGPTGGTGAPHPLLDWVIVGGESGGGSRAMNPEWARSLRDQCVAADVPFLFKQWGSRNERGAFVGKSWAGRELDGRTWDEYPAVAS